MVQYQELPRVTRSQAELQLKTARGKDLCLLLLGMCELEDWKWVQGIYLSYVRDEDKWVASAAISGLGHLARISGKLDKETVLKVLSSLTVNNPELKGKIEDAISDIETFV